MIKQKLIDRRNEKNITQEDMAFQLGMNQSQYSRREAGITKISNKEWNQIAKILKTSLKEIYEPQDGIYIIHNESTNIVHSENDNHFVKVPNYVLDTIHKYIEKLEEENIRLRQKSRK